MTVMPAVESSGSGGGGLLQQMSGRKKTFPH
jgi:hypothetical protein